MEKLKTPIMAPSVLASDFSNMEKALALIDKSGGDWVHFDVMDGSFVPDITFGHKMVRDMRHHSTLPFDVHLMIMHPESQIAKFAHAGADRITIQAEVTIHLHRLIMQIKGIGRKAGISIVPSTPPEQIKELLPFVDLVLVMTVNPGYGGQKLIPESLKKVAYFRQQRKEKGYDYLIEIDGGVNKDTRMEIMEAKPDVIVTGSAFFKAPYPDKYLQLFKKGK
ncbi:MAG: ribulose-phosphate 3-epimerase [Spirochaetales bacterium]|nr:ribulose-phosphate 3-epimerase [Spirochaetales bacterium]